jgi:hypothetical protein
MGKSFEIYPFGRLQIKIRTEMYLIGMCCEDERAQDY